jgi:hypothetical protein
MCRQRNHLLLLPQGAFYRFGKGDRKSVPNAFRRNAVRPDAPLPLLLLEIYLASKLTSYLLPVPILSLSPDKNPGDKAVADRFARLGTISGILRQEESRKRYDVSHVLLRLTLPPTEASESETSSFLHSSSSTRTAFPNGRAPATSTPDGVQE